MLISTSWSLYGHGLTRKLGSTGFLFLNWHAHNNYGIVPFMTETFLWVWLVLSNNFQRKLTQGNECAQGNLSKLDLLWSLQPRRSWYVFWNLSFKKKYPAVVFPWDRFYKFANESMWSIGVDQNWTHCLWWDGVSVFQIPVVRSGNKLRICLWSPFFSVREWMVIVHNCSLLMLCGSTQLSQRGCQTRIKWLTWGLATGVPLLLFVIGKHWKNN